MLSLVKTMFKLESYAMMPLIRDIQRGKYDPSNTHELASTASASRHVVVAS